MVQEGSSTGLRVPDDREISKMAAPSRRRHRRVVVLGRCFAQLGGGWEASVQNLSVGGMLLRLTRKLTPGSTYFIKLFLENQIAIVEARVLRTSSSRGECLAAFQFISSSGDDAAQLRGYVQR